MKQYIYGTFEKNVKEDVEESRTLEFIINSERKDRHKDILNYDGWRLEEYNANPIVGYQHNVYGDNMCFPDNPDNVLGVGNAYIDKHKGMRVLVSSVKFEPADINPLAEKIFRKVLFGSLKAASVGIVPTGDIRTEYVKDEKGKTVDQTNYWPGQTLLEWSIVNIPANADSLRKSMKNHTNAALEYVQKLCEDWSLKDIKGMTVQQVLDAIEKKYSGAPIEEVEKQMGTDPEFLKQLETIHKTRRWTN